MELGVLHGLQVSEGDMIGARGVHTTMKWQLQMSSEICFVCWLLVRCLVGFDEGVFWGVL